MQKLKVFITLCITLLLISHIGMANATVNHVASKQHPGQANTTVMIDINTATIAELKTLHGIGLKKAVAIVAYREQHGPFHSVNELTKVKGISQRIVAVNQAQLQVSLPTNSKQQAS